MKVLVSVASRHGSTEGIAQAITDELRARGVEAHFQHVEDTSDLSAFDAVVLGSAVYMGNWMSDGVKFVEEHKEALASIPVWLFSSGPIGSEDPNPRETPSRFPA